MALLFSSQADDPVAWTARLRRAIPDLDMRIWPDVGNVADIDVALVANLAILTLLLHPNSPVSLPTSVFDDSTGFRTRLYWAQLIAIAVVTPLSFLLNKVWTFSAVRGRDKKQPTPPKEPVSSGQ